MSIDFTKEEIEYNYKHLWDLGHKIGELHKRGLPYEKEKKQWKRLYAKTKRLEKTK